MISLQVKGVDGTREYFKGLQQKLDSPEFWASILVPLMEGVLRFAASISPVVTGSYQASHRLVVEPRKVILSIDPTARNSETGVLVSRYAANVEEIHGVYGRAEWYARRQVEGLLKEKLLQ